MGKQLHGRYSGRALRLIREAKDAGRIEEAKAALREYRRKQRKEKKAAKSAG
jgi:CelD/BcsL family acetyltransferase involved in cellulose biosynthesis